MESQEDGPVVGIVLAAGKATRMGGLAKAAIPFAGRPLGLRVIEALHAAGVQRALVVVGHEPAATKAALGDQLEYVLQCPQLGTGHALACCAPPLEGFRGTLLVAYGDLPLLAGRELARLLLHHRCTGAAATLLSAVLADGARYGRVVRTPEGSVWGIVEAKDATAEQLALREINVGVYCFEAPLIFQVLAQLSPENVQGEYYLTDAVAALRAQARRVEAVILERAETGLGVNTEEDLRRALAWADSLLVP